MKKKAFNRLSAFPASSLRPHPFLLLSRQLLRELFVHARARRGVGQFVGGDEDGARDLLHLLRVDLVG